MNALQHLCCLRLPRFPRRGFSQKTNTFTSKSSTNLIKKPRKRTFTLLPLKKLDLHFVLLRPLQGIKLPRFIRFLVFGFFFREYRRYLPDLKCGSFSIDVGFNNFPAVGLHIIQFILVLLQLTFYFIDGQRYGLLEGLRFVLRK